MSRVGKQSIGEAPTAGTKRPDTPEVPTTADRLERFMQKQPPRCEKAGARVLFVQEWKGVYNGSKITIREGARGVTVYDSPNGYAYVEVLLKDVKFEDPTKINVTGNTIPVSRVDVYDTKSGKDILRVEGWKE